MRRRNGHRSLVGPTRSARVRDGLDEAPAPPRASSASDLSPFVVAGERCRDAKRHFFTRTLELRRRKDAARDENPCDGRFREPLRQHDAHCAKVRAVGQNVVEHADLRRQVSCVLLVELVDVEQILHARSATSLPDFVRRRHRHALCDHRPDVLFRSHTSRDLQHAIVVLDMIDRFRRRNWDQNGLVEPSSRQHASEIGDAPDDRSSLVMEAMGLGGFDLEVLDQRVGVAERVVAIARVLVKIDAAVFDRQMRVVVDRARVDAPKPQRQPTASQMSSSRRTRRAPCASNRAGQVRSLRWKQESKMNSLRP